jgi:hypothetical protein
MEVLNHPSVSEKTYLPLPIHEAMDRIFKNRSYGKGLRKFSLSYRKALRLFPSPMHGYDPKRRELWCSVCFSTDGDREFYLTSSVEDWHRHLAGAFLAGILACKALGLSEMDLDGFHADVLAFFQGNVLAPGYTYTPPPVYTPPPPPPGGWPAPPPEPTKEEFYAALAPESGQAGPSPLGGVLRAFVPDLAGLEEHRRNRYTPHLELLAQALAVAADQGDAPEKLAGIYRQGFGYFAEQAYFYDHQSVMMAEYARLGRLLGLADPVGHLERLDTSGWDLAAVLGALAALRAEKKYRNWWPRSKGYYMGLERITNELVDRVAEQLLAAPRTDAVLAVFDEFLGKFEDWRYKDFTWGDTEDREMVGDYFNRICEITGITSSRGLLPSRLGGI